MPSNTCKRLAILFALLCLIGVTVGLTGQTVAGITTQAKTLDRDLEPVIITGAKVAFLSGTPVEHLFVYTYTGTGWGGQIPIQVDEVTATGSYTTTEDGLLDANDEIVLMAQDLGDQAPDTTWLTSTLPISSTWYELGVSDPTDPAKKGWVYLVRSSQLVSTVSDDYVDYNPTTQRITASQYELGFPTNHTGFDYLALNGGSNILDRAKLRAVVSVPLFGEQTLTEDTLGAPPGSEPTLIKDGRVRVLLGQAVSRDFMTQQISLSTMYKAYAALLNQTTNVSFIINSPVTLISVRTSVDFDSTVSGVATFFNANTPSGVTIDGNPDTVAQTPLSKWGQVSHTSGRLVQVVDSAAVGGTQKNYYKDDGTVVSSDTGDQRSYGDTGILFEGSLNETFTLLSSFFVLSPGGGGPNNVGETYETYFFNPLQVFSRVQGKPPLYLPIIFKSS